MSYNLVFFRNIFFGSLARVVGTFWKRFQNSLQFMAVTYFQIGFVSAISNRKLKGTIDLPKTILSVTDYRARLLSKKRRDVPHFAVVESPLVWVLVVVQSLVHRFLAKISCFPGFEMISPCIKARNSRYFSDSSFSLE